MEASVSVLTSMELVGRYLRALEFNDADRILSHFADDAKVTSPNYGRKSAKEFYQTLCKETANVDIRIHEVVKRPNKHADVVYAYFKYDWLLKNGQSKQLELLDRFKIKDGKIQNLRIHVLKRK